MSFEDCLAGMHEVGVLKARVLGDEVKKDSVRGPVTLLGNDDLGLGFFGLGGFLAAVVIGLTVDEGHHVGVLFDRARLAQVAQHGPLVFAAPFTGARELGKSEDRKSVV